VSFVLQMQGTWKLALFFKSGIKKCRRFYGSKETAPTEQNPLSSSGTGIPAQEGDAVSGRSPRVPSAHEEKKPKGSAYHSPVIWEKGRSSKEPPVRKHRVRCGHPGCVTYTPGAVIGLLRKVRVN
jgi:hypothetical protein